MCQRRIIVRSWEVCDICKWKPEQYSNVLIAPSHDRCWKLHLMCLPFVSIGASQNLLIPEDTTQSERYVKMFHH